MRTRRRGAGGIARATASLLVAGVLAGPFALTRAAAAACSDLAPTRWVTIEVPDFPEGNQVITDYAVSPSDPRALVLTNGRSVLSSSDAGCSFRGVFALSEAGLSYPVGDAAIKDLHLGSADGRRIYLAIEAFDLAKVEVPVANVTLEGTPRPHVVVTNDGGATWREGDAGLDAVFGTPLSISSTTGSQLAYLLVDEVGVERASVRFATPQTLYGSSDGGSTWEKRSTFKSQLGSVDSDASTEEGPLVDVILSDPYLERDLWLYGRAGVFHSTTGGASYDPVLTFENASGGRAMSSFDIYRTRDEMGAPVGGFSPGGDVLAFAADEPRGYLADDGGRAFRVVDVPSIVESGVIAAGNVFATASVDGSVRVYHPDAPFPIDISIPGQPVSRLQNVTWSGRQTLYGQAAGALKRRTIPRPLPNVPTLVPSPPIQPELPPTEVALGDCTASGGDDAAVLTPAERTVVLEPGEERTIEHRLRVSGVRKVDVAFLVDTSASMQDEIDGLRAALKGVITDLSGAGVQASFGVGSYRSYRDAPAYHNHRDIGPCDDALERALNELRAAGSTETQLAALYQLATGQGQDEPGAFIAPGQQMSFRSDALHVVVHGTDADFDDSGPNPSFEEAAAALKGVRALHVGLSYLNDPSNPLSFQSPSPTRSLQTMSVLTGARAPGEGADCDGDDAPDVAAGAPLVCEIPPGASDLETPIGEAIVGLVEALEDRREVALRVTGDLRVVSEVVPSAYQDVDFKTAQTLTFRTTVVCPPFEATTTAELELVALAEKLPVDEAAVTVVCEASSPPVPRGNVDRPPVAAAAVVFPPAQRPPHMPQPPQVQSPVNQVQGQTQAQSQAQAQAGVVAQRQQQPQTAAVKVMKPSANLARVGGQGQEDLQFSSYSRGSQGVPSYLPSYVVAVVVGGVLGASLRPRTQRRPARVRVRSGRAGTTRRIR